MRDMPEFVTPDAALEFLAQTWIGIITKEINSPWDREYDRDFDAASGSQIPDLETAKIDVQVPGNILAMLYHFKGTYERAYEGQTKIVPGIQYDFSSFLDERNVSRHAINACFDDFSDFLEDRMDETRTQALHVMMAADMVGISYPQIFSKRDLTMPSQEL